MAERSSLLELECKEFEEWPQLKAKEQSVRGMSAAQSGVIFRRQQDVPAGLDNVSL